MCDDVERTDGDSGDPGPSPYTGTGAGVGVGAGAGAGAHNNKNHGIKLSYTFLFVLFLQFLFVLFLPWKMFYKILDLSSTSARFFYNLNNLLNHTVSVESKIKKMYSYQ